ncbi:LOW QUALITY PROTEIN: ankyrin repeat domain-containing protein SOWAHB [Emydura macquarii macquarii]|uniref:LOW QUALITY PROTEIN: ankyrin repeat domain-containing protein SOWAHB n=1 Tax=Emydura macquarii macquarii TaxID=1129001 RepID=UPI003529D9B4
MARELSQEELLDFLCQAGGRVTNAALLGHFQRFLRDPGAAGQVQQRREQFKGFVNSVATVKQEAGGPKYVVLRKRYRDFLGQALGPPREPGRGQAPPAAGVQASGAPGGLLRERLQEQQQQRPAPPGRLPRGGPRRCPGLPPADSGRQGAEPPPAPAAASPAERCVPGQPNGPCAPAPAPARLQRRGEKSGSAHPSASSRPCPALVLPLPAGPEHGWGRPPPIFRSIRCQLALHDLEDFIEQESGEDCGGGSSSEGRDSPQEAGDRCASPAPAQRAPGPAQGASDGPRGQGVLDSRCPQLSNGWPSLRGAKGQVAEANGAVPCTRDLGLRRGHRSFRSKSAPGSGRTSSSSEEDELTAKDHRRRGRRPPGPGSARGAMLARGAILAPPDVDTPITFQHFGSLQSRGSVMCVPAEEVLPAPHRPPAPRLSSMPLDRREHNWVVMVAAGSWMQVRALFLEDPQLALQRDFISGYTALHWIAKHGAKQVLQDFISGAEKAGIHLDVNVKSSCGYTPLHLAAIHGHQRIMMLLVQKLKSKVHLRDSSGKKPWQYLSSSTSGEVWQLLQAPKGKTIFSTQPLVRHTSPPSKAKSQEVARSISRKTSLAACLKPQHMKWKMATKNPALREREEYSD